MFNTQIADIMKTFSAYEMNSFEKFVISPFFNKNEKVISLFRIMERYHPEFEDPGLKKEAVFREIFGNKKFDDKQMRYLSYELFNLAKEYLEYTGFKKDKFLPYYTRLIELEKRKQQKFYEKTLLDAKKVLQASDYNKPDYYLYSALLERSCYSYEFAEIDKEVQSENFIKEIENLICHFIISLTFNLYDSYSLMRANNNKFEHNTGQAFLDNLDLKKISDYLKENGSPAFVITELSYNLIMMLQNQEDQYFYKAKELLKNNSGMFTNMDLYNFYSQLESFCIRRNRNSTDFVKSQFEIYKIMLGDNICPPAKGSYFNDTLFSNIVRTAARNNELDWALEFIEGYGKKLHPKIMTASMNFCYAQIYFSKKDFEKSLSCLSRIPSSENTTKEQLKSLTIKIYYELNLIEPFVYQLEAFRRFIAQTKELSDYSKASYLPFIKFTGEMIKLKDDLTPGREAKLISLKKEIEKTAPLGNKKWIIEKVNELISV